MTDEAPKLDITVKCIECGAVGKVKGWPGEGGFSYNDPPGWARTTEGRAAPPRAAHHYQVWGVCPKHKKA
jgi:hypothetical protein